MTGEAKGAAAMSGTKPLASLTAGELTAAGKSALAHLAAGDMVRTSGGWYGRGKRVSLGVADVLRARGLARSDLTGSRHKLTITGAGRQFAAVLEERRKRA